MLLAAAAAGIPRSSTSNSAAAVLVPALIALGHVMQRCLLHTRPPPTPCIHASSRAGQATHTGTTAVVAAAAAAAGSGGRRRRRAAAPAADLESEQQLPQQQPPLEPSPPRPMPQQHSHVQAHHHQQQQQQAPQESSWARRHPESQQQQQQLFSSAVHLGLCRAAQCPPELPGAADTSTSTSSSSSSSARPQQLPDAFNSSDSHSSSDGEDDEDGSGGGLFQQRSAEDDEVAAAIARLTRFLEFRERSASEVLAKLAALGYPRRLAGRVLDELQQAGLQDDARFAEMFVRGGWRTKASAPARLAHELRARGVEQQHVSAALTAVFGSDLQRLPPEPLSEQEEEAWRHLVEACRQQAQSSEGQPQGKRRQRLANWLQRRGHSLGTAFKMFDALGV